ncbi:MAG: hypothetical protein O9331_09830, partial [Acidovorax sp.]|nr:hypothetical protein [Acidovorax sp.]
RASLRDTPPKSCQMNRLTKVMVLSKTNNKLTRAVSESLNATERWDDCGIAVLDKCIALSNLLFNSSSCKNFLHISYKTSVDPCQFSALIGFFTTNTIGVNP